MRSKRLKPSLNPPCELPPELEWSNFKTNAQRATIEFKSQSDWPTFASPTFWETKATELQAGESFNPYVFYPEPVRLEYARTEFYASFAATPNNITMHSQIFVPLWEKEAEHIREGWIREDFVRRNFTTTNAQFSQFVEEQIEEQHAVQHGGRIYPCFLHWLKPRCAQFVVRKKYVERMLALASVLSCFGVTLVEMESLTSNTFVLADFAAYFDPEQSAHASVRTDVVRSVLACRQMQRLLPSNLVAKPSMYMFFYRTVLSPCALTCSKASCRTRIAQELDRMALAEQCLRVAGMEIAKYVDLSQHKYVCKAFADNAEICLAFTLNQQSIAKVENELLKHYEITKPKLSMLLDEGGFDQRVYRTLVMRAAQFPSKRLTLGIEAVKREVSGRLQFGSLRRKHFVVAQFKRLDQFTFEYLDQISPGYGEKEFDSIAAHEPQLVEAYMNNTLMGTAAELAARIHLKQCLMRSGMEAMFEDKWEEMLAMAKMTQKGWEKIRMDVLKQLASRFPERHVQYGKITL